MQTGNKKFFLATLGCPKNEVDSEGIESLLTAAGVEPTDDAELADLLIVNSCGFINEAKIESLDTLFELHRNRKQGSLLALCGCLPARYDLDKSLGEVDIFLPSQDHDKIVDRLRQFGWLVEGSIRPQKRTRPSLPYSYLKISEGCDNRCTYCAIPGIKGGFVSREEDEIVREAEYLCSAGVKELVVVGQDTSMYGHDQGRPGALAQLLGRLAEVDGCEWIRLMYMHPAHFTEDLIETIALGEKIVKYIDLPLQHINDRILKLMNRKTDRAGIVELIGRLRRQIPDLALRTTFIVGFPGETDDNFRELLDFCEEVRFENLGAFKYSPEDGTPAEKYPGRLASEVIEERYLTIMDLQNKISREKLEELVGRTGRVLLCERDSNGTAYARAGFQAPEVDGRVIVYGCRSEMGRFMDVRFEDADSYDLYASPLHGNR
jgi:ribosomal protein S12 methylthiotransferase